MTSNNPQIVLIELDTLAGDQLKHACRLASHMAKSAGAKLVAYTDRAGDTPTLLQGVDIDVSTYVVDLDAYAEILAFHEKDGDYIMVLVTGSEIDYDDRFPVLFVGA